MTQHAFALARYKMDLARSIVLRLATGHDRAIRLAFEAAEIFDIEKNQVAAEAALAFACEIERRQARQ